MTSTPAAQDQRASAATRVRSITVLPAADGSARVVIEADGALSPAESDVLNGPPRIYFDFPGLLPADRGAEVTDSPAIRRVRVALHSSEPRVTRVVIDLVRPTTHRIEPSTDPSRLIVCDRVASTSHRIDPGRSQALPRRFDDRRRLRRSRPLPHHRRSPRRLRRSQR